MRKRKPSNSARTGSRRGAGYNPTDRAPQWIYGHHAVVAAISNPARRIDRLIATPPAAEKLAGTCPDARPEIVDRSDLGRLLPDGAVHQGIAAETAPPPAPRIEDVIAALGDGNTVILVLDQVTDPQNVGAVLRSAAAFGAAAVILQDRHAPPSTGALAKAASGALEIVPLARVVNLARALAFLKEHGFWCVGLADTGGRALGDLPLDGRIALVMGAEDSGLRRLTLEACDTVARLPTRDAFATLNVSTAAAVALYEVARRTA